MPLSDKSVTNATVTDTLVARHRVSSKTLSVDVVVAGTVKANMITVENVPNVVEVVAPLMGDGTPGNPLRMDPNLQYYEWLGQSHAFNVNTTITYWNDFGGNGFGPLDAFTTRFVTLNDLDSVELYFHKSSGDDIGVLTLGIYDVTGATMIPGAADLPLPSAAANPSFGVSRYTFTSPLSAGTPFTISLVSSMGVFEVARVYAMGVIAK
jgi:hypothetical protein